MPLVFCAHIVLRSNLQPSVTFNFRHFELQCDCNLNAFVNICFSCQYTGPFSRGLVRPLGKGSQGSTRPGFNLRMLLWNASARPDRISPPLVQRHSLRVVGDPL